MSEGKCQMFYVKKRAQHLTSDPSASLGHVFDIILSCTSFLSSLNSYCLLFSLQCLLTSYFFSFFRIQFLVEEMPEPKLG